MKKTRLWLVAVMFFVLLVVALAIILFYGWFLNKMARVDAGTARATFPYADYSIAELNKLYPQYIENNATTTQSPEQTHQLFVDALKKGDFDTAVKCCFREGDQAKMKEGLQKVKDDGYLQEMVTDLDQSIKQISSSSVAATYSYSVVKEGKNFGHRIDFLKNDQGVWLIESL